MSPKNPEYTKRADDKHISIPVWVASILIGLAITFSGVVFKSLAATEAKILDKEHTDVALKRFDDYEMDIEENSDKVLILENNLGHVVTSVDAITTKVGANGILIQQNHDMMLKIIIKLDIE